MAAEPSQLRMVFTRFEALEPPSPPPGYALRTYRPGDDDAWIELLNTGQFGEWDHERLRAMLAGERAPLPREAIFFATRDDRPVGAACVFLWPLVDGEIGELGWVAVHPDHRGRGLGAVICRAALAFVRDRGLRYCYLGTEDFRLAAIKTYLRLGFQPELLDHTQPARWAAIRRALGLAS